MFILIQNSKSSNTHDDIIFKIVQDSKKLKDLADNYVITRGSLYNLIIQELSNNSIRKENIHLQLTKFTEHNFMPYFKTAFQELKEKRLDNLITETKEKYENCNAKIINLKAKK